MLTMVHRRKHLAFPPDSHQNLLNKLNFTTNAVSHILCFRLCEIIDFKGVYDRLYFPHLQFAKTESTRSWN